MDGKQSIVIIGAGETGTSAAKSLRDRAWNGAIILIDEEDELPYERPPLSKSALTDGSDFAPRLTLTARQLSDMQITFRRGVKVASVNRATKHVIFADGERLSYDRLLLATGARPRALNIPIEDPSRVTTLRTNADALRMRQSITRGKRVIVVGGGLIGLELAAGAVQRGADVTVVEAGQGILERSVPPEMARLIQHKHEIAGVQILTGAKVMRIAEEDGGASVHLSERTLPADVIVVGIGAEPNVELARASGLTVENGVLVDEMMATSDPSVFAAGDCCSFPHPLFGKRMRLEAWRNANRQGTLAAANMLGGNEVYEDVPWFWSDHYDETLQMVGHRGGAAEAVARDLGSNGRLSFHLSGDGRLVAACGFGRLGTIAKEIHFAESMISKRLSPDKGVLGDPSIDLKRLSR